MSHLLANVEPHSGTSNGPVGISPCVCNRHRSPAQLLFVARSAIASSICDVEGCQLGRVQSPSFLVLSFAVADVHVPVRMELCGACETLFCGGGPAVGSGVRTEGPAELAAGFSVDPDST